eukprot:s491_g11.t1
MEVGTDESVVAISFDENSTGKTFADTKVRYTWEVMVDGKVHRIEFTNTKTSGKKRIFVDGRLLHEMTVESWLLKMHFLRPQADFDAEAMSLRTFSLLSLLLVSLAENVPNETSSTWKTAFIYCQCGLSCAKQLGSWYVFDLGTNCGCMACVENTTSPTPALRGSDQGQVLPVGKTAEPETSETSQKLKSLNMERNPEAWEAASVRGSKVLYCRCGYGCAYGRQLGMTTYYCFRYGCKPCPH